MKSILKFSTLAMVAISVLFTACNPDDDIIIDPGTDGIQVGDGFYMASTSGDPTATDVLVSESVEDDGFSSQDRTGFLANYIYVAGGSYNIVEIADKAITKTWGGSATTETDMGSGCGYNDYSLVNLTEDGAAVSVGAGLYKVTFDQTTGELILIKIESGGLIGSATPGGWGSDTELAGSVTADGGSWSATDVTLREGEYKVRFNCRWNLDRRIDPTAGFGADNAYQLFTNLGGSASELLPGNDGPNIPFAAGDDAIFTVTLNWTAADGFTLDLERTGDAPVITFTPDDNQWAIIGDATAGGWDTDTDFNYEGFDMGTNTYTWLGASIDLTGDAGFKFRTNDSWDNNIGWGQVSLEGDISEFSDDNGNIKVSAAGAGMYKITLTTSDDGDNYNANFEKL